MSVTNDQMTVDAKLKQGPPVHLDISAAAPAERILFFDPNHDAWITGIRAVVAVAGNGSGADVTVNVGSVSSATLIGTLLVAKAATPAGFAMVAGTMTAANKSAVYESAGGIKVPKGTAILAAYTPSATNTAEYTVHLDYFLQDETTFD